MRASTRRDSRRAARVRQLVAGALTFGPAALSAQDSLRLGALLERVQRSNPRVELATARAEAAHARIAPTRRLPDPQLQVGAMNYTLPSVAPMPTVGMLQLQLMQMIPLGGKRRLATEAATNASRAEDARAADAAWDVRARTATAFFDGWRAEQQLALARDALRLMQELARTAEARYAAGDGRQADVLRAQVEVARMREDTLRMQAMRTSAVAQLSALLDTTVERQARTAPIAWPSLPPATPTRAHLDSLADENRPMLRAGRDDVRAAMASEARTRRERLPDLQVGVQLGRTRMPADAAGMSEPQTMGSIMLGASLPIYPASRQRPMQAEARAMTRMAEAELEAMRADTRARLGEVHAMLDRAQRLAALYRTSVLPQADAAAASALAAYRSGVAEFMTTLESRLAATRYRQELVALDAEQGIAWAELEMLTGTPWLSAPPPSLPEPR